MSCNLWLEINLSLSIMHFWTVFLSYLKTTSRATGTSTNSIQFKFLLVLHCTMNKVNEAQFITFVWCHKLLGEFCTCNATRKQCPFSVPFACHVCCMIYKLNRDREQLGFKTHGGSGSVTGCVGIFESMQNRSGKSESHSKNPCGLLDSLRICCGRFLIYFLTTVHLKFNNVAFYKWQAVHRPLHLCFHLFLLLISNKVLFWMNHAMSILHCIWNVEETLDIFLY